MTTQTLKQTLEVLKQANVIKSFKVSDENKLIITTLVGDDVVIGIELSRPDYGQILDDIFKYQEYLH